MAKVQEVAGVYVPFWTYDAHVESSWTAEAGYYYYETEEYTTQENGQEVTKSARVQHTRWERAWGHRADDFDDVLVCASVGLPRELADKLATFDTHAARPLLARLPRRLARRGVRRRPRRRLRLRARQDGDASSRSAAASDVPGDTQRNLRVDNTFSRDHLQARALARVDRGLSLQQPDLPLPRERTDRRGGGQGAVELGQDRAVHADAGGDGVHPLLLVREKAVSTRTDVVGKKVIRVVAAVVENDGLYLITQRRESAVLPLKWEFPGGKVERGEADEDALKRELRERLDADAQDRPQARREGARVRRLPRRARALRSDARRGQAAARQARQRFPLGRLGRLRQVSIPRRRPADDGSAARLFALSDKETTCRPRRRLEPSSLGEVTAGHFKSSIEGLTRLASPHPSVRYILDVLDAAARAAVRDQRDHPRRAGHGQRGPRAHAARARCIRTAAPLVSVSTAGRPEEAVARRAVRRVAAAQGRAPADGAVGDADGGTLVLDEVIGLSPALQRRLLELVKRGRYHREFEDRERVAQVNVIVITDGNLLGRGAGRALPSRPLSQAGAPRSGAAAAARAARRRAGRGALDGQPRAHRSRAAADGRARGRRGRRAGLDPHPQGRDRGAARCIAGRATSASSRSSSSARSCSTATARRSPRPTCTRRSPNRRDMTPAERIARDLGMPDLVERLVDVPANELTSLLLEVTRRRKRTPADLLAQYARDRIVRPTSD